MLQHVGDGDLKQGLSEELLAHRAAVIVVFLRSGGRKSQLQSGINNTDLCKATLITIIASFEASTLYLQ